MKETLQENWTMLKSKIKEKWSKLTDEDISEINGRKDQLLNKLQKKYGLPKERAEQEIANWEASCGCSSERPGKQQQPGGQWNKPEGGQFKKNKF